jgi:hypothetical protein
VILDQPRPKKRVMGRLLWPAVITIAAVVAVVASGAGAEARAELEYLGSVQDHAAALSLKGDSLRVVISRLARVERDELITATDAIGEDLAAAMELTEAGPPSQALVAANALFREAVEAWTVGVSGFTSAILAAADDPANTVVVDNIANSLAELRSGDRLYEELVQELSSDEVPEPAAPMPAVIMLPAEGELFGNAQAYAEASRSVNSGLALRPGLKVSSMVSNPLWRVSPDDQAVMPATETATFSVVVTNVGNIASDPQQLALTLSGTGDPIVMEEGVRPLEPGEQTAVVFNDLVVAPGGVYEVIAELAELTNDVDFDDNSLGVVFTVNEEGSG